MMKAKHSVRRGRMLSRLRENLFTALPIPRGGWTTSESGDRDQFLLQGFRRRRRQLFTCQDRPYLADVRLGHVLVVLSRDDGRTRHHAATVMVRSGDGRKRFQRRRQLAELE